MANSTSNWSFNGPYKLCCKFLSHCSSPLCTPSIPAPMKLDVWKVTRKPVHYGIWWPKNFSNSQHGHEIFSTKAPRTISRAHPFISLFSGCYKPFLSSVKHLWHEAAHSPPRTTLQRMELLFQSQIPHMPSWFKCLITHEQLYLWKLREI
jgi:hypothetical protein